MLTHRLRKMAAGAWSVSLLLAGLIAAASPVDLCAAGTIPVDDSHSARAKPSPDRATRLSAEIDHHVSARWADEKVEPAPLADDAEFLRRTYLNIAGRIPSSSEVQAFLEDRRADKRRQIVDRLLESPGYPNHFADLLRSALVPEINADFQLTSQAGPFNQWLRRRIAENVGYDRIVRELLTAPLESPGPGFYFLAKGGKPETIAAGAARVFLGTRIECAQCHNHPFAKWRREQFWEFAAFFAGIQQGGPIGPLRQVSRKAELRIPDTNKIVQARFLDGVSPKTFAPEPRQAIADWILAERNPYFAKAAVNRIWAHFLGTGLIDPIDDFDESNPPSHPELLDALAGDFAHEKYDVKFLVRAICLSRPYQLSSVQTDSKQANRRLFARAAVKGLRPMELAASVAQAVGDFDGLEADQIVQAAAYGNSSQLRTMIIDVFNSDTNEPVDAEATIRQALALMNSPAIDVSTAPGRGKTLGAVLNAPFLDTAGRIESLYLSTLSRQPTPAESARFVKYVEAGGTRSKSKPKLENVFQNLGKVDAATLKSDQEAALGDLFWVLLNSNEFLTNH